MFIDQATILVRSGKGGDGAIHFRREKYVPRGGPDGGDGGHGGDVILEVNPHLNTLGNFQHKREFNAPPGAKGQRQNMTGKSADDLIVPVPPGTLVFDEASAELIGDLTEPGQRLIVCKGGRGGRGNQHFATSSNQAPRIAERGVPGEERTLRLELKLIADIGIVGVPNAGKSTFLSVVTNARPKIAPYPFTTLEPNLGVANLDEDTTLILADIPGLIEGAHMGIGLGHDFLRHIQRTRVLIHLLDGMAENPILDFAQINTELSLFDASLAQKPQVVALNKMDLPDVQARWPEIEAALKAKGYEPMSISAVAGTDVRKLLYRAAQLLEDAPPASALPTPPAGSATGEMPIYRPEEDPRAFTITHTSEGYRVSGASIERAAAMTYWEEEQSIRRFQNILKALGIEDALRKAGVQEGDTVFIGDEFELEWSD
jgi:GTP-binding protein